ncbi:hypothetical protein OG806_49445 [Streptomyces sp. NBC_00882]|uniref:hypothetical protein n=1 Tax=Streptomyces TaxID=1883 RepID=UPI00386EEE91|nr:hypothetical protein OG806_00505 [Streptomyces sp. NBC_00882]WSZ36844.1 hypothetical protein OG806_49445 [Streptomyces sp. NBC_00882]WSZ55079.1 hypothetical protein OH824_00100 [Streptomyces canus]WSZ63831.1 hypothetical protein OH824_48720 [Streptomyces canus]
MSKRPEEMDDAQKRSGANADAPQHTRLSVNINSDTAEVLRRMKMEKGISITEAVRRAISLLDLLESEHEAGNKIQLVGPRGRIREVLLLS